VTFSFESELTATISDRCFRFLKPAHVFDVHTEFRVGSVIPDILAVKRDVSPLSSGSRLRGLTSLDCAVLAALSQVTATTSKALADRLYSRNERIKFVLARLESRKLVTLLEADQYEFCHSAFPLCTELVAVEAKLSRWRDALAQAQSYLAFANQTFVALPLTTIDRHFLPIVDECQMYGIGLISVHEADVDVVIPARFAEQDSADWFWTVARTSNSGLPTTGLPRTA
jgi:hypothetical protein